MFSAETHLGRYQPGGARKRAIGLVTVILLHAAIIYALVTGLAHRMVPLLHQPVMATVIEDTKPPPPAEPLFRPKPAPPIPAWIPPPEIRLQEPPAPKAITAVTVAPAPPAVAMAAPAEARAGPIRVPPVIDAAHSCRTPEYPPAAKRLGQTGAVIVKFLIDVDGSVADSAVEASSGYRRLDEAAREALSLCHFKPGTVDGRPERSWAEIRYVWTLN
jgi:protein TonB